MGGQQEKVEGVINRAKGQVSIIQTETGRDTAIP